MNDREISKRFTDVSGKSWNFTGLRELMDFLEKEHLFWEAAASDMSDQHKYISFQSALKNAATTIESWGDEISGLTDQDFNQKFRIIDQNCIQQMNSTWLWSGHAYAQAFIECNRQHGQAGADAFFRFVEKNQVTSSSSHQEFMGMMLGYEYRSMNTDILKRREHEEESFQDLKDHMEKTTGSLFNETSKFKVDLLDWKEDVKEKWEAWVETAEGEHADLGNQEKGRFDSFMSESASQVETLETVYEEKLRLSKPAEHWDTAAKKYRREGYLWGLVLVTTVVLGLYAFVEFYSSWLLGQKLGVELSTVQGVVMFGTGLAIYAFFVRAISRLTFSSFHLMRDSQERQQLTYLYLSLINDNAIDPDSRDIVLQALFSRSETGLLAAESGPTMPGGISDVLRTTGR